MESADFSELMPVEVFIGGTGNIVLSQEWPSLSLGERYSRIMLPVDQARELAAKILKVAGQ